MLPDHDTAAVERFLRGHGFHRRPLLIRWLFERWADFEAVVRIEFPPEVAEEIIAGHPGCEVDYALNLWWRRAEAGWAGGPSGIMSA